jgi:uncharacterized membrane protein
MQKVSRIVMLIIFAATAALAALWLADFAHYDLGISRHTVRSDALLTAAGISGILIFLLYSDRFGKK